MELGTRGSDPETSRARAETNRPPRTDGLRRERAREEEGEEGPRGEAPRKGKTEEEGGLGGGTYENPDVFKVSFVLPVGNWGSRSSTSFVKSRMMMRIYFRD